MPKPQQNADQANDGIDAMKLHTPVALVLLAGCAASPSANKPAALANPASTYCVEQHGTVEIRKEAKGEVGYCHLPDGRVIEEWELFRSKK